MDYLTAVEVSKKWNLSSRMVAYYCEAGRIEDAVKRGKTWLIPASAEKPADKRRKKKVMKLTDRNVQSKHIHETEKADIKAVYHTRDVYHHLGFTRETLRYYEEMGLIRPRRDRYSQYREFGFYDMSHLMAIDFYRKRGFTPVQMKKLLKTEEQQEYGNILLEQIAYLHDEIEYLQELLKRLQQADQFYRYATNKSGEFEIREMPSYYVKESISSVASFQEYREKVLKYLNLENEDILSNMVRVLTFDKNGYKGSGMYIVAPLLKSEKGGQDKNLLLEGRKCLYTTLIADNNDDSIAEKMFDLCHKWAAEHREVFCGMVHIFIRFVMLREQTDRNFYEVWIPLK